MHVLHFVIIKDKDFLVCAIFVKFLARQHGVQKSYCSHPGRTHSRHTLLKGAHWPNG